MAVIGSGTTINGASTAVTPFVTSRAVTSIVANLGGGNDQIGFSNSAAGFENQLGSIGFTPAFNTSTLQGLIDAVALPVTTFSLPGSLSVTTAAGDDAVILQEDLAVRNGVSILTGPQGEDRVEFRPGVTTGAGNDYVVVDTGSIGGGLAINSGAGDDFVGCKATVALNTVIDAGAGNDFVFSSGLTTRSNLFVYLGPGNDRLELSNTRALAAFLYGGTGTNELTTNAATRTGIRTLRYPQFQTVNNV